MTLARDSIRLHMFGVPAKSIFTAAMCFGFTSWGSNSAKMSFRRSAAASYWVTVLAASFLIFTWCFSALSISAAIPPWLVCEVFRAYASREAW
ncbi:hypothetical protein D9M69_556570 [compost metagenome]